MKELKNNIIAMIKSCESEEQIESCKNFVKTFEEKIPFLDLNHIKLLLEEKIEKINNKDIVVSFSGLICDNSKMIHIDLENDKFCLNRNDLYHFFDPQLKETILGKINNADKILINDLDEVGFLLCKYLENNVLEDNIKMIEEKLFFKNGLSFVSKEELKSIFVRFKNVIYLDRLSLSSDFNKSVKMIFNKDSIYRYDIKTLNVNLNKTEYFNDNYDSIDLDSLNNIIESCEDKPKFILEQYINNIEKIIITKTEHDEKIKKIIIEIIELKMFENN